MPSDFPDRLADAVRRRGPLCVGLDPRAASLPAGLLAGASGVPAAFEAFCLRVLDLVEPFAGVVKPQAAFFEQYGAAGLAAMGRVLAAARRRGFVTVLDAKRGDIASTAAAYAHAAFAPDVWGADAVTVNPYLGADAVEPFVSAARAAGGGLFVLVRTSNPGGGLFQDLDCGGRPLYRAVADAVADWNAPTLGDCGLGAVGAVVGATHPRELAELREAVPDAWFLVPGYGAQGGTAADCRAAFRPDGLGAIVNSSRGVTFPFDPADPAWEAKIAAAARRAQAELSARD